MDNDDPEKSSLLEKNLKGSLQNAYFASKLQDDYDKMRNRKEESASRRVAGGRHLIPGGPVTVGLCRDIDERQLLEEKEQQAILKQKRELGILFWRELKSASTKYANRINKRARGAAQTDSA
ncbi:hypothetical protein QFC20_007416 [Naganishia adeliensis]|uniref:Uncharacterized protein n=1 Tax=Naganishia adeliensis TaxID=92952 RepID=A0ACC2UYY4_9TREE|nr:hypothetical protein QFC20_007416 [Naganishia adeliensis]